MKRVCILLTAACAMTAAVVSASAAISASVLTDQPAEVQRLDASKSGS